MAKKKDKILKTELLESDKFFIIENRLKLTESELAGKVGVEDVSLVSKFLEAYVNGQKPQVTMDDYAAKRGAVCATPQASQKGDESEKHFNSKPPKVADGVFYIGKKAHLNDLPKDK